VKRVKEKIASEGVFRLARGLVKSRRPGISIDVRPEWAEAEMIDIGSWLHRVGQWCGTQVDRIRRLYEPLADLRITILVLILGGLLLLGLDAGKDVIRGLVDSANATDFSLRWENVPIILRWITFLLACIWTGLNAWYWAHLLYKSNPSSILEQPLWFTWVRRVLGVSPLIVAIVAMPLSARHGLKDTWLALLIFTLCGAGLLWFFVVRNRITERISARNWRLIEAVDPNESKLEPNTIVRGDGWFVYSTLGVSICALLILCIPIARTHFAWALGPAALTFGAFGCIIPVTSLLIYGTRQFRLPVVLIGLWAFVIFSLWNDNHAVRTLRGSILPSRPTVATALKIWQQQHRDPADPLILIAAAGGASRAAYWTATVLRAFDDRTQGAFFEHVFAISSVSGGTLGAIGYAAWLADRPLASEATGRDDRRHFLQTFFGQDYLGPSMGALLYPDLFQRFFFLPVFPDRAGALEEAFELGWNNAMADCENPPCGAQSGRFSEEFTRLWANSKLNKETGRWVPLVLANGTHVETGKRIITAPVAIESSVFEDSYDFYALNPGAIRTSTAVLNSARFTLVSPPGRLMRDGQTTGGIIDGGYFENGALETVYDLARSLKANDPDRKIIIIEILNDDEISAQDLSRHPPAALDVAPPPQATWYSELLGEFTSIIGGLYHTRSSRGVLWAKRLSAPNLTGLSNTILFSFDLRPYGNNWHTALSWTLSIGSLDAMDVSFNTTLAEIPKFLEARHYTAATLEQQKEDLEAVVDGAGPNNETLNKVLDEAGFDLTIRNTEGPAQASRRK